jgi:type I restriction enzyme R subunit
MSHGLKVAEGDRLGKIIVFAKTVDHATFIANRFDANDPHLAGPFAARPVSGPHAPET